MFVAAGWQNGFHGRENRHMKFFPVCRGVTARVRFQVTHRLGLVSGARLSLDLFCFLGNATRLNGHTCAHVATELRPLLFTRMMRADFNNRHVSNKLLTRQNGIWFFVWFVVSELVCVMWMCDSQKAEPLIPGGTPQDSRSTET